MTGVEDAGYVGIHSQRVHDYPIDLLRGLAGNIRPDECPTTAVDDPGEVELSLGLSLGGCFGTDPRQKKLDRSSSIASLSFPPTEQDSSAVPGINRTFSLPAETEERQRKRKELQSLRRLEAKRKRTEKRNSKSGFRDRDAEGKCDEEMPDGEGRVRRKVEVELSSCGVIPTQFVMRNGVRQPGWALDGNRAAAQMMDGKRGFALVSQGSIGSQGSNSSSISDFDSRSMQGLEISGGVSCPETWCPLTIQQLPDDHTNQKGAYTPVASNERKPTDSAEDSSKMNRVRGNGMRDMMQEMPCVFTRGDGPGGRRIEGFLYRYKEEEEVRIVCLCHGSFLSPAEFVKHAGGGDVAHPLRHIVVTPPPTIL